MAMIDTATNIASCYNYGDYYNDLYNLFNDVFKLASLDYYLKRFDAYFKPIQHFLNNYHFIVNRNKENINNFDSEYSFLNLSYILF